MQVTKHYEHDHVILYVEEDGKRNCITLESDEYPIPEFPEYINKIKEYIKELCQ